LCCHESIKPSSSHFHAPFIEFYNLSFGAFDVRS
jgi:hypothetical protein